MRNGRCRDSDRAVPPGLLLARGGVLLPCGRAPPPAARGVAARPRRPGSIARGSERRARRRGAPAGAPGRRVLALGGVGPRRRGAVRLPARRRRGGAPGRRGGRRRARPRDAAARALPTFLGQEDQGAAEVTLREVVHWHDGAASGSAAPSMAVCVAQAPLVAAAERDATPQRGASDDPPDDGLGRGLRILEDGRVAVPPGREEDPALAPLASLLRLPAYLLLGDPRRDRREGGGGIVLHHVNLWYAPQASVSNVHCDDHDNLLLVTEGVKTVEL